jgi:hypothetical protein
LESYHHGTGYSQLMPTEVVHRARQALEPYIRSRIETSALLAMKAWEWYGFITKPLVSKFGLEVYAQTRLAPGIGAVDGLSAMVLCASKQYHENYVGGPVSKQRAMEALAIVGEVGLSRLPLRRTDFSLTRDPPFHVWVEAVREFRNAPGVLAGVFLCMLLVTDAEAREPRRRKNEDGPDKGMWRARQNLINEVLALKQVQKLKSFPALEQASRGQALFGE